MMNKAEINVALSSAKNLKTVRDAIGQVLRGAVGGNLLASDLADDIFGDVCVKLLSSLASYDASKGALSTFIATVSRHTAIDALRSYKSGASYDTMTDRMRNGTAGDDSEAPATTVCGHFPSPEHVAITNQTRSRIAAYVSTLPARERDVYEAMRDDATADSAKEVCERYGMTVNNARIVLCRVRKNVDAVAMAA